MILRPATHADLQGILDIYNEAVLNTTATADYELQKMEERVEWFESRKAIDFPIYVAEGEGGLIVGWSSLSPYHARYGYRFTGEVSVYVHADYRGQRVGSLLLPPIIASARELGMHVIVARIDRENKASIRLHERNGFEHVGCIREVFCKFGRWLDVANLQLILDGREPT